MGLGIANNIQALYALNQVNRTDKKSLTLQRQLGSGRAINTPADNPAGYDISQGLLSRISGTNQAIQNINQGLSLVQTAAGALGHQAVILQKMRTIAVQAANGTQTAADRQKLQKVIDQLNNQVNTIANQTQFNGLHLLNGSLRSQVTTTGASGATTGASSTTTSGTATSGTTTSGSSGSSGPHTAYASGSTVYTADGSATSGNAYNIVSGTALSNDTATATLTINGPSGSATVTLSGVGTHAGYNNGNPYSIESAYREAKAINAVSGVTGVSATSKMSIPFVLKSGLSQGTTFVGSGGFLLAQGGNAVSSSQTSPSILYNSDNSTPWVSSWNSLEKSGPAASSVSVSAVSGSAPSAHVFNLSSSIGLNLYAHANTESSPSGDLTDPTGSFTANSKFFSSGTIPNLVHGVVKLHTSSGGFAVTGANLLGFNKNTLSVGSGGGSGSGTAGSGGGVSSLSVPKKGLSNIGLVIQNGGDRGQRRRVTIQGTTIRDLGTRNVNVTTAVRAQSAIKTLDNALKQVHNEAARLGAYQRSMRSMLGVRQTSVKNNQSAQSVIRDANLPRTASQLSRQQMLHQSGLAALKNAWSDQKAYITLIGQGPYHGPHHSAALSAPPPPHALTSG